VNRAERIGPRVAHREGMSNSGGGVLVLVTALLVATAVPGQIASAVVFGDEPRARADRQRA
jgi:hypothetical protein